VGSGGQLIVNRPETLGARILLAGITAGVFVCTDLQNAGPRNADAFESEFDIKAKASGQSSETISVKGQVRDSGWFSVKLDGTVLDLNPTRVDAVTAYGFKMLEPVQMEKSAVTETRVTLGMWDDWVRWTSRQAVSNYIKPGADPGYLGQTGVGFSNGATSQRIETGIFKTDSMKLSVFADYARVGAYFAAPDFAIKRQDPFSKPNSTTTRLGAIVEQGPFALTLEQRNQQSLAQDNAPIHVQNQIGASLNFDKLLGRSGNTQDGLSWIMPSSAWLNVGQGRMRAELSQGVNGDTTSDVSAGLSWTLGKIYANLGYWQSDYKSQLYPWKGLGINGSLGFHEELWGIDIYFDISSSLQSYALTGMPQPITETRDVTSGLLFRTRF
jgi:hypothetical protein